MIKLKMTPANSSNQPLFKMLPDAFVFNYVGDDRDLVKLSLRPNPNFHPPSMEARVFHDMEGEMWVDCKQERLAAFSGHLTRDVKFGLALLRTPGQRRPL